MNPEQGKYEANLYYNGQKRCWRCGKIKAEGQYGPDSRVCSKCLEMTGAKLRKCLGCERQFLSRNDARICGQCKESPDWKDENHYL